MQVGLVTVFPEMLAAIMDYGMTRRAIEVKALQVLSFNPRDYAEGVHRKVDDRPYGGGPGMVLMVEPLRAAIQVARQQISGARVVYLSPQGRPLQQDMFTEVVGAEQNLILIAGRYEGIDERLIELEVDAEWSIGDYVLSGGELAAMVVIDAVARHLPGVLGDADSAEQDSFTDGLLDCPHYTRPEQVSGLAVPEVLKSGNHAAIRRWRLKQSLGRTWQRRPELLDKKQLDEEQQQLLAEYISECNTD
ncbi:MAG: tRNA (guanosine(37)-N1)-methyltransferase TrmD [Gammaproteobacteria bacterium]